MHYYVGILVLGSAPFARVRNRTILVGDCNNMNMYLHSICFIMKESVFSTLHIFLPQRRVTTSREVCTRGRCSRFRAFLNTLQQCQSAVSPVYLLPSVPLF